MATAAFAPVTGAVDNGKSYNVEKVLRSNIVYSEYYRQLCKITDFMVLVDEIYNEVTHVEPWMSGNARGPSTAFCVLYRLFTLRADGLDDAQIRHLLNHGDSPYIRALGFLYLRYVCPHKELEKYFEPHFGDLEEIAPTSDENEKTTVGQFARDLICDQYYFETIFPRIPEVTRRALVWKIKEAGFSEHPKGCGGVGGSRRGGAEAGARPRSVKAALAVAAGQRAPHVGASAERGRGIDPSSRGTARDARDAYGGDGRERQRRERERSRSRDGGYPRGGGGGGGGDRRVGDGDWRSRSGHRDANRYHPYDKRNDGGGGDRHRSRSRDREASARGSRPRYE